MRLHTLILKEQQISLIEQIVKPGVKDFQRKDL